jgi:hypothetical protein
MAQINIAALRKYEQQGLLTCRAHPIYDLLIWNYTPNANMSTPGTRLPYKLVDLSRRQTEQ